MRISDGQGARPAHSSIPPRPKSHAEQAQHSRARPPLQRQRTRRELATPTARHLPAGTARRALDRNLAHLRQQLTQEPLAALERRNLEQSATALEACLHDHRTLRTNMVAMILG